MRRLLERKEKEPEELLPRLLMPSHIMERPDHIAVNDRLNRVLMAVGYPRLVELGFLDRIIRAKGDFDISLHVQPASLDAIRFRLNRLIVKQKADLIAAESKGVDAPSLRILYEDTLGLLRLVERGEEKVFDIGLYINIKGKKPDELSLLTSKVKAELDGIGIISRQPTFRMRDGLQSMLPLATDGLKALRTLTTSALAECFPFTSSYLDPEAGGIILATNRDTGVPIIRDLYALTNPNVLVAGTSGGGKSYFAKLLMARQAMRDVRTMVIDPNGEYGRIVKALGGEEVDISRTSDTIINVFDLMGYPLDEKRLSLMDALALMLGKLTTPQKAVLDEAVSVAYAKAGMTKEKSTWGNRPPVLKDLYDALTELRARVRERERQVVYESLILRLKPYVFGAFSFMNRQTHMDASSNPISFNIRDLPRAVRPVMMYIILDYVYSRMRKEPGPKMVLIDEAWSLLSQADEAPFLLEMVKTSRKFHLSLAMVVQELRDLAASDAGRSVLANTSSKFFFKQDPAVIDELVELLHLNAHERRLLLTSGRGEGLAMMDLEHVAIKVLASPREDRLVHTTPGRQEKEEQERPRPAPRSEAAPEEPGDEIELSKGFYKESELAPGQVVKLKVAGYRRIRSSKFGSDGTNYYWILPKVSPSNEGMEHLFLAKVAEEVARRYTGDVMTFQTRKPDVVFKAADRRWVAIEVETGQTLRVPKKLKEKLGVLEKYPAWFFLVTDRGLKAKYAKHGDTITRAELEAKIKSYF
jgi:hypothetical protein